MSERECELSVLILARNEAENLRALFPALLPVLSGLSASTEIILVDGSSTDETREVSRSAGVRVIEQNGDGYGAAFRQGVEACRGEWIATLDADHSHPPQLLRVLFGSRSGSDIVVASRYVSGGGSEAELWRRVLSRLLNIAFALILRLGIRDLSSGYRLYRRTVLREVNTQARDFDVLVELLIHATTHGFVVREIPFIYQPRSEGSSKAKLVKFAVSYLRTLAKLWQSRNSLYGADYEERAYRSLIPFQRVWQRRRTNILRATLARQALTLELGARGSRASRLLHLSVALHWRSEPIRFLQTCGTPAARGRPEELPFPNSTFEQVLISEFLPPFVLSRAVLREVFRVLKPSGVLIFSFPDSTNEFWAAVHRVRHRLLERADSLTQYRSPAVRLQLQESGFRIEKELSIFEGERVILARRESTDRDG